MAPKIEIATRGMKVGEDLEDFLLGRTEKLDRYIHGIQEIRIDVAYNKNARNATERYKAQITVFGNRFTLRSEERAEDIRTAFDAANRKMQSRISRYKGKRFTKKGGGSSLAEEALKEIEAAYQEEEAAEIVRRKTVLLNPMDEDEALEQMKLLDHENFFLFFNVESNSVNVLYKRKDGDLGLIRTELA